MANVKMVAQLDVDGYFQGMTTAQESPLEPGIYLMPALSVDAEEPAPMQDHLPVWNSESKKWDYVVAQKPIVTLMNTGDVPNYIIQTNTENSTTNN
jgi:hypothetical protein